MRKRDVTIETQIKVYNYIEYSSKVELASVDQMSLEIIKNLPETLKNILQ